MMNLFRMMGCGNSRLVINITAAEASSLVGISEIEFRTIAGDTNSKLTGITLTASTEQGGAGVSNALDGNTTTYWGSTGTPATVTLAHNSVNNIVEIAIRSILQGSIYAPKDFTISKNGVVVATYTNQISWGTGAQRLFAC